ncbi:MAG: MFS transporter [Bacteroidota bacterium]|nr:MFS transporter [Bacteroidota bacterium]
MSDSIPKIKHDPFAALRIKEFLFFLTTRFFLTLAIQMQSVIIGWQIYQHTKDVLALGLIGLAEAIPFIIVSLVSGHVADSFNRKHIIVLFTTLLIICTSTLLYFSLDTSTIIQTYGTTPIFIVIGAIGVIRGFLAASFPSFMAQIIPRALYTNSSTWNSTIWHIASVIGPAAGGFICAISFTVAYEVNIVLIVISVLSFLFIASKPLPKKEKKETLKESLSAGIKFVFGHQLILGALTLDLFAVLFGGAVAMLPAYADKILHVGSVELGFLRAVPALGAVIMALIIIYKPPTKNAGRNLFLSVGAFGVATILFGISTNFYLSLFFLFLTGAFDNVSVVIRHTILQLSTPDSMRGRVSAVNSIFIGSSNEIGAFESGVAASAMGLKASVAFGGIMTILIVAATAKIAPKLRKLNLDHVK